MSYAAKEVIVHLAGGISEKPVRSVIGLEAVNAMAQGLKLGGKGGDLSLELKDSLSGGGTGSGSFGPIVLGA
jgi:hypothetical protein